MAGKINRQVKHGKAILVNGMWVHQLLDTRPMPARLARRLAALAKERGLHSA